MATIDHAELTAARCAHVECHCVVNLSQAVRVGSDYYCSQACAKGTGCTHEGCACAQAIALRQPTE